MDDGLRIVHNPKPAPKGRSWPLAEAGAVVAGVFLAGVVLQPLPPANGPLTLASEASKEATRVVELCRKLEQAGKAQDRPAFAFAIAELRTIADGMASPPECARRYLLRD